MLNYFCRANWASFLSSDHVRRVEAAGSTHHPPSRMEAALGRRHSDDEHSHYGYAWKAETG